MKHKLVSFLTRYEEELGALFEVWTEDLHIVYSIDRLNTPEEKACEAVKDADVIVAFPGFLLLTR